MKTVRIRIEPLKSYARQNPKLKVIHLIRDPRAVEASRSNMSEYNRKMFTGTGPVCDKMHQNIEDGKFSEVFCDTTNFYELYRQCTSKLMTLQCHAQKTINPEYYPTYKM